MKDIWVTKNATSKPLNKKILSSLSNFQVS